MGRKGRDYEEDARAVGWGRGQQMGRKGWDYKEDARAVGWGRTQQMGRKGWYEVIKANVRRLAPLTSAENYYGGCGGGGD